MKKSFTKKQTMFAKRYILCGFFIFSFLHQSYAQHQSFNYALDSAKQMIEVYFNTYKYWEYIEKTGQAFEKKQQPIANKTSGQSSVKKSEGDSRNNSTTSLNSFVPKKDVKKSVPKQTPPTSIIRNDKDRFLEIDKSIFFNSTMCEDDQGNDRHFLTIADYTKKIVDNFPDGIKISYSFYPNFSYKINPYFSIKSESDDEYFELQIPVQKVISGKNKSATIVKDTIPLIFNFILKMTNKIEFLKVSSVRRIHNDHFPNPINEFSKAMNFYFAQKSDSANFYFNAASVKGSAEANNMLAVSYMKGIGVKEDTVKAFMYLRNSAQNKNAWGNCNVGLCYLYGYGVDEDNEQAYRYINTSALQNDALGLYYLGILYNYGWGTEKNENKSIEAIFRSARKHNLASIDFIGSEYLTGGSLKLNSDSALYWYELAAEMKSGYSNYALGNLYLEGTSVTKDIPKAFQYYKTACDLDCPQAYLSLAKLYNIGKVVTRNCDTIQLLLNKAYQSGNSYVLNNLGLVYKSDWFCIKQDYPRAIDCFRKAIAKGSSNALDNLGLLYYLGTGIEKDVQKGIDLIVASAKKGDSWGLYHLGMLHYSELVKTPDKNAAYECFKLSSEKGNDFGTFYLGLMYADGLGKAEKNCDSALLLFRQAIKGESAHLLYLYGRMLQKGICINQNDQEAFRYYKKAAMIGDATSQYYVASSFEQGLGVEKNEVLAYAWYSISAETDEDSKKKVAELNISLSSYQINKALELKKSILNEMGTINE